MNAAAPSLRLFHGEPDKMAALQRLIESAPTYAERITGAPPGPADAQSLYSILPPDKSCEDKFVFGLHEGDRMVGCIDLIRRFPDEATAHIGLLLIAEPDQGRGLGRAAVRLIEDTARGWPECRRLRLAVVRTNETVLPFWTAQGFAPTGEVKPYRYGRVESESVILAKPLARP